MRAAILERPRSSLVISQSWPDPVPSKQQVVLSVEACGVCRTDLHVVDGDLQDPKLPLVLGHEIIGRITQIGAEVKGLIPGQRVGVPWLAWTCQTCKFCLRGEENLCTDARFTGYTVDGGYAELAKVDARFCFPIDDERPAEVLAPLMCAGLIGWRSFKMAEEAEHIGLYGFGAAAHIITQVAVFQGRKVYAFTRSGDNKRQDFALRLGAVWAGSSDERPPVPLDAAIILAPSGDLIPTALNAVDKGGVVICAGIHMSDIPAFPYQLLWQERSIRSVANLTRQDGTEFLQIAREARVETTISRYALEQADRALQDLRSGAVTGAAVLVV